MSINTKEGTVATINVNEMTLSEDDILIALMRIARKDRSLLFQSKANRDAVWKRMNQAQRLLYRRASVKGQLLDPRYTFEGRNIEDKGLGNDYRHFHGTLYEIAAAM